MEFKIGVRSGAKGTKKAEANALQSESERIDREIDGMAYALYGLSEEEIGIVGQA